MTEGIIPTEAERDALILELRKYTGAGPLSKRTTARAVPVMQDLLEYYVKRRAVNRSDIDFQGYVNIDLLNAGFTDLIMLNADFDWNAVAKTLTVTALWAYPSAKQSFIVDICFREGETVDPVQP